MRWTNSDTVLGAKAPSMAPTRVRMMNPSGRCNFKSRLRFSNSQDKIYHISPKRHRFIRHLAFSGNLDMESCAKLRVESKRVSKVPRHNTSSRSIAITLGKACLFLGGKACKQALSRVQGETLARLRHHRSSDPMIIIELSKLSQYKSSDKTARSK